MSCSPCDLIVSVGLVHSEPDSDVTPEGDSHVEPSSSPSIVYLIWSEKWGGSEVGFVDRRPEVRCLDVAEIGICVSDWSCVGAE